jgi:hypothetical protein
VAVCQVRARLGEHRGHILRLDGHKQDVGVLRDLCCCGFE